jgi:D-glycero-D-manno-heptose 1,7-bisphosphate phosphatase
MNKALFLDRDGVINKEKNHLYKIDDFNFIDGIFEVCRQFQLKKYLIVVVTNQAGIAKGLYSVEEYELLTEWMVGQFLDQKIEILEVYHCPHHPDFSLNCNCRKPKPGMFLKAEKDFNINLSESIMVGDKDSDICAAISAGIRENYLVKSGHPIIKNSFNVPILKSIKDLPSFYSAGRV